ncbi:hypothetical protein RHMOL_Rhmol06G0153900 [Rhododendron molle]|uniref:Uncharacterized protein n=1 Tax=Rhododendron molle TaxID=49168 RepID=A0ACC0NDE6_RHOML|nr:hypothetical protein RHMOL_Rhmol06G0153900 [Rhododendron molle]
MDAPPTTTEVESTTKVMFLLPSPSSLMLLESIPSAMPPRSSNQDEIDTNEEDEVWSGHNEEEEEVSSDSSKKRDAEAMHSYFMKMKADNSDFFFAMDLDDEGRLRNVFWADARSRTTCKEFGDVVTFDTTYLVNRYDMPFAPFVGVNHHDELEKQFQSAYTNAKAKEFQDEFVGKLGCSLQERKVGDVWLEYEVKEWVTFGEGKEKWKKRVSFTVDFNGETNEANCNCRLFKFRGMVCRHQLMVFHDRGVQRVPDKYILRRWRKDVKRVHTKIRINYANSSTTIEARRHDNMCNLFNEVADLAEDCQEKYAKVMGRLRELKEELIESSVVCGSSMGLGIPNDSLSLGDGVVPSKESRNILDPEVWK